MWCELSILLVVINYTSTLHTYKIKSTKVWIFYFDGPRLRLGNCFCVAFNLWNCSGAAVWCKSDGGDWMYIRGNRAGLFLIGRGPLCRRLCRAVLSLGPGTGVIALWGIYTLCGFFDRSTDPPTNQNLIFIYNYFFIQYLLKIDVKVLITQIQWSIHWISIH